LRVRAGAVLQNLFAHVRGRSVTSRRAFIENPMETKTVQNLRMAGGIDFQMRAKIGPWTKPLL
jgi:hypothetical protein